MGDRRRSAGLAAEPPIEPADPGVPTGVPGFTLRLLAGGPEAAAALRGTGLLRKATSDESPFDEADLLAMAGARDGFLVLGEFNRGSAGFILGQVHAAGRNEIHLFIRRAFTQGPPAWGREAWRFLDGAARALGCDAISAVVPARVLPLMRRRYHCDPKGAYVVRRIKEGLA